MSRKAEEAADRQFALDAIEDAKHFVVGAKVYRAAWERIEEGVLRKVERCHIRANGNLVEDVRGDHARYVAQFGGSSPYNGDWVEQTYAWKFFWSEAGARKALVSQLHRRINEKLVDIRRWEALITEIEKEEVRSGL